jgi:hypothetical protein
MELQVLVTPQAEHEGVDDDLEENAGTRRGVEKLFRRVVEHEGPLRTAHSLCGLI